VDRIIGASMLLHHGSDRVQTRACLRAHVAPPVGRAGACRRHRLAHPADLLEHIAPRPRDSSGEQPSCPRLGRQPRAAAAGVNRGPRKPPRATRAFRRRPSRCGWSPSSGRPRGSLAWMLSSLILCGCQCFLNLASPGGTAPNHLSISSLAFQLSTNST
jgi:hypothetical protein